MRLRASRMLPPSFGGIHSHAYMYTSAHPSMTAEETVDFRQEIMAECEKHRIPCVYTHGDGGRE